jgi:hypothetical protein
VNVEQESSWIANTIITIAKEKKIVITLVGEGY